MGHQTFTVRSISPSTPWRNPVSYVLDQASVRAVDQAAVDEFGMPGIVLMENAARALLREAIDMLCDQLDASRGVLVICGSGNNGGDGWALARHLKNALIDVKVMPLGEPKQESDAGINCAICRRMGLDEIRFDKVDSSHISLVVDAIFGTGLTRPPEGKPAQAIDWINRSGKMVLAVDVPSGLDCDRGRPLGAAVRATRTVSFVGLKPGFLQPEAHAYIGEVVIGDIGAPRELTERFGRQIELALRR